MTTSSKRPGGRSTRVKTAVFDAAEALLVEKQGAFPSMGEIAERAGVNPTSLYRRWNDVRNLLIEVAVETLMRDRPIADLGSVRDDLNAWAVSVASVIGGPGGMHLLRIVASEPQSTKLETDLMKTPIGRRIDELNAMLERGRERGETVPGTQDVLEIVLAPLYLHALFLGPIANPASVTRLVDRVLLLAARLEPPPG
jgi:AcrR family transcriptional regulator